MGWTTVETDKAKFIVTHEAHLYRIKVPPIPVDGWVLEELKTGKPEKRIPVRELPHYKKILASAASNQTTVFPAICRT